MSDEKNNNFYVGSEDWTEKSNFKDAEGKIKLLFKKYLLLDNVNFLFGTGSSIHLGAESIQEIPECIEIKIQADGEIKSLYNSLKHSFQKNLIKGGNYWVWKNKKDRLRQDIIDKLNIKNDKFLLDEALGFVELEDEKNQIITNLVGG